MLTINHPIPEERKIPGFSDCLNEQAVLDVCRSQLLRVDESVRKGWASVRRIEALYHPGRYLRVAYVLLPAGDVEESRYWPEGQLIYLQAPLREPLSRRGTRLQFGSADVEAYVFPNDRRLRGMRKFAGRDTTAKTWAQWAETTGDGQIVPKTLQRLLVRYVPEQKWIIRLRAEFVPDSGGEPVKRRLAVRCARSAMHAVLRQRHDALNAIESNTETSFCVPKIIGSVDENTVLAVEWIRGTPLVEMLQSGDAKHVLGEVASRLANLHQTTVPDLPSLLSDDLAESARLACEDLAAAEPKWGDDLQELQSILCSALSKIEVNKPVTLHNDLHLGQISCKRERVILFDLERMAMGDAMRDVATMATQLRLCGPRPDFEVSVDTANQWSQLFLDAWCSVSGSTSDREKLSLYSALAALELGRGMMRHLKRDWVLIARSCIEFALQPCSGKDRG